MEEQNQRLSHNALILSCVNHLVAALESNHRESSQHLIGLEVMGEIIRIDTTFVYFNVIPFLI